MRIHLTDGTHQVEIDTPPGRGTPTLPDLEATAHRLLDHLRAPHPDSTPGIEDARPFGFTPTRRDSAGHTDDSALDGTALGSDTDRAEPYIEPGREPDDDCDCRARDRRRT